MSFALNGDSKLRWNINIVPREMSAFPHRSDATARPIHDELVASSSRYRYCALAGGDKTVGRQNSMCVTFAWCVLKFEAGFGSFQELHWPRGRAPLRHISSRYCCFHRPLLLLVIWCNSPHASPRFSDARNIYTASLALNLRYRVYR